MEVYLEWTTKVNDKMISSESVRHTESPGKTHLTV